MGEDRESGYAPMGQVPVLAQGFRLRRPEWNDFETVLELLRSCEVVDEGEVETTADDLRADWRLPGFDLARDAWIVSTAAGRAAGYACVRQRVPGERFDAQGYTRPEFRDQGIGTALVREIEQRAREQAHAGALLRTPVNHANSAARRLWKTRGASQRESPGRW